MLQRLVPLALVAAGVAGCQPAPTGPDPNLARLLDRQAIEQLLAGDYPHALDTRDFDAYAALFTEDGELSLQGNTAKGRAAIKAFVGALPAEPRVIHPITNLSYTIERRHRDGRRLLAGHRARGRHAWRADRRPLRGHAAQGER